MITSKDKNCSKITHLDDDDLTMICYIYETSRFSFWQSFPRDFWLSAKCFAKSLWHIRGINRQIRLRNKIVGNFAGQCTEVKENI